MKKASASILLGLILDFIFIFFFLFILLTFNKPKEEITLHMNQIGMFKETENRDQTIQKLKKTGLSGYFYEKDGLFIVVTSIQLDKNICINEQNILNEHNIKYIYKEITTKNHELVQAAKNNNVDKVLELISK
ncbi:MAG: hypothetical protein ACI4U3_05095 [Traorella sp.]